MKKSLSLLSLVLTACLVNVAPAAIEFSEDQVVAAVADESPRQIDDDRNLLAGLIFTTMRGNGGSSASSTVTAAQTGSAGSAGTLNGMPRGTAMVAMGGGGGGQQDDGGGTTLVALESDNQTGGTEGEMTGGNGETGATDDSSMATPEPQTVVVWSLLILCGVVALRSRLKK